MSMGTDRLTRTTAACGLTYFVAMVVNILGTAVGPNHREQIDAELARVAAGELELRFSAALGVISSLAFAGMAIGLALILSERGQQFAAALTALAGTVTASVWTVSFAALAASSLASESGYGRDAIMSLGLLHTTTFLIGFTTAGAVILAGRAAPGFGRVGTVLSVVVGVCACFSALLVIPLANEQGLQGLPLIVAFWGVPLWGVGAGFRLLRPRPPVPSPGPPRQSQRSATV